MGRAHPASANRFGGDGNNEQGSGVTEEFGHQAAEKSAAVIRAKIGKRAPTVGIILGSGLGGLADKIENAVKISYADIPGFPIPKALGHSGTLVCGTLGGKEVIAMAGRFHIYEGHP